MQDLEIDIAKISIMGREFKIKCPKDKVSELQKAASYLEGKMAEVKQGNNLITIDRVAITAALNIAHELMLEKEHSEVQSDSFNKSDERFSNLKQKLDQALATLS